MNADWQIVLAQITEWDHAAALMKLFEYRDDVLYANDSSIDELDTGAELVSERGLAALLAEHLGEGFTYIDFYSPSRGCDPTPDDVTALVERCRAAGVNLHHRTR